MFLPHFFSKSDAHASRSEKRGDSPPFTSWSETRAATAEQTSQKKKGVNGKPTPSILSFFAKQKKSKTNGHLHHASSPSCASSSASPPSSSSSSSSSPCGSPSSSSSSSSSFSCCSPSASSSSSSCSPSCSPSSGEASVEVDLDALAASPAPLDPLPSSLSFVACAEEEKEERAKREETKEKTERRVSPYGIWVSEVMLQQTQVCTVIDYWQRWMSRWPTVTELAKAEEGEVSQMWSGLGYYRRARQLLKGAQTVVQDFAGELPGQVDKLLTIPGIGPYTGGAISAIAFGNRAAAVDGNVLRVLSRLLGLAVPADSRALAALCSRLMPPLLDPRRAGASTEALIELGATICTPRAPSCLSCPVRHFCLINQEAKEGSSACRARRELHSSDCKLCISFSEAQAAVRERQQAAYPVAKAAKARPEESYVVLCVTRHNARDLANTNARALDRYGPALSPTGSPSACTDTRTCERKSGKGPGLDRWEVLLRRRRSSGLLAGQLEVPSYLTERTGGAKTPRENEDTRLKKRKRAEEEEEDGEDTCSVSSDVDITHDQTGTLPRLNNARAKQEKETKEPEGRPGVGLLAAAKRGGYIGLTRGAGGSKAGAKAESKQPRDDAGDARRTRTDNTQKALRGLAERLQASVAFADTPAFVGEVSHAFSHVQHMLKIFWVESKDGETPSNSRESSFTRAMPKIAKDESETEKQAKPDGIDCARQLEWVSLNEASVLQALTDFLRLRGDCSSKELVKAEKKLDTKTQTSLPSRFLR
ncbi:putative helix-hairpin-helix motif-containing protein [Neospora caninum Liverpool]|uniref:Adenine DNA glycosylase n=1 Tax=Neospora caninum (strain Liverpool) TaxID=572307 RepID=F0VNF6_NEOCL|nr:putative helix-hairpin-helix motif-containing protein [Neospora caninum Liverpool]CBZ55252.1 putative helix-hairpin-helix motif-containing protein [Neospora caninum Liverpool]|eukprot:XP_003885280.1 putative helix-hairpin-helix motif-containing protein [Neospora caninum Liverpool]